MPSPVDEQVLIDARYIREVGIRGNYDAKNASCV